MMVHGSELGCDLDLGLKAKNGFYKGIMASNLMMDNINLESQYVTCYPSQKNSVLFIDRNI